MPAKRLNPERTPDNVPLGRLNPEERWTQDGVQVMTLSPEWGWIGGSTSIREENEGQRGRWVLKGGGEVDCEIPHRLGRRTKHSL